MISRLYILNIIKLYLNIIIFQLFSYPKYAEQQHEHLILGIHKVIYLCL